MRSNSLKVLALGDVVGPLGVGAVSAELRKIKHSLGAELVLVNGENAYSTNGLDSASADAIFRAGADVITGGNHSLHLHDMHDRFDEDPFILRPINLSPRSPGKGYTVFQLKNGKRILVISACGQVFMDPANSPFYAVDKLLEELKGEYDFAIADLHAEATSEKHAFFRAFDGRINIMYGTHTHVQTADEMLLPNGSASISDLGMCGVIESVLGVKIETVVKKYMTGVSDRFSKAEGDVAICGALFTLDLDSGKVSAVERVRVEVPVARCR